MLKRIFLTGIVTSIVQIILYTLLIYLGSALGMSSWEDNMFAFQLSILLFSSLLLIINILIALVNKRFWTWLLLIALSLLYAFGWGEDIHSFPLSAALYLIAGLTTIASKFLIEKLMKLFLGKIQEGFVP